MFYHQTRMILFFILFLAFTTQAQDCKIDLLFLFDSSGSVRYSFDRQIQFLNQIGEFLQLSPEKHRIAIVVYSGHIFTPKTYLWDEFPDIETFRTKLKTIPYLSGTTQTGKGMKAAYAALKTSRSDADRILISMTDGRWDDKPEIVLQEIKNYIPDILTFAVSISKAVSLDGLTILAGDSGRVFVGPDVADKVEIALHQHLPGCLSVLQSSKFNKQHQRIIDSKGKQWRQEEPQIDGDDDSHVERQQQPSNMNDQQLVDDINQQPLDNSKKQQDSDNNLPATNVNDQQEISDKDHLQHDLQRIRDNIQQPLISNKDQQQLKNNNQRPISDSNHSQQQREINNNKNQQTVSQSEATESCCSRCCNV